MKDHVDALCHIESKCPKNQRYCIGGNNELSNIEIINDILLLFNSKQNLNLKFDDVIKFVKDRPGHDFKYSVASRKIEKYGWKTKHKYKEALINTFNWYHG